MKKETISELLMNACVLILGICLTIWADKVTTVISIILGVIAVFYGIAAFVNYFNNKDKGFNDNVTLVFGIIVLVLGGILIFKVNFLKELISIIVGIYILLTSVFRLLEINKISKSINTKMTGSLVLSIIGIILGIMCITSRFLFPNLIVTYIGVLLIIYSIINVVNLIIIGRK